jgi:outer membrane receptor protein involved in Fe transport
MEIDFISHLIGRIGVDIKAGRFFCSPRLTWTGRQHIGGIADTTQTIIRRQTIPGYQLLNVSFRYVTEKKVSVFMNISNALNQRYRNVGFNMDLNNTETELFYGQRQDPVRFTAGLSWEL